MGKQRPDADDRVVDVFWELVTQLGSNLVIGLAGKVVRGGKAFQIGDCFDISNDHVAHVVHSTRCPLESLPRAGAAKLC